MVFPPTQFWTRRNPLIAAAMMASLCGATAAHAATPTSHFTSTSCNLALGTADNAAIAAPRTADQSKSAAILGGQPSALDLIRNAQQQWETGAIEVQTTDWAISAPPLVQPLQPALGGARHSDPCFTAASPADGPTLDANDFLASKRVSIGQTSFDRDWRRVTDEELSTRRYRKLVGGRFGASLATMRSINSWVNGAIAFTEDRNLFARADYWAGASTTLKLRRGDCEDIAITKMQLLLAAGFERDDLILTIARDLIRNADHAVLIVRNDGRYYMLDNATDELLDASLGHDYRPILSFGFEQAWLHGF